MRRILSLLAFVLSVGIAALMAKTPALASPSPPFLRAQTQAPPASIPQKPQQGTPAPANSQPAPVAGLQTIVLDPAHGGTDTGARGPGGLAEKDLVLEFAQAAADVLRAEGFQVVETRRDDSDPSLDERAAMANAQTNAIYISLHIGSSGRAGTVRTYTYLFPSAAGEPMSLPVNTALNSSSSAGGATVAQNRVLDPVVPAAFVPWAVAQKPYLQQSGKLGDLIQIQLALKFKNSPEISTSVPVAGLRSIEAPAIAIEISNMSLDQKSLEDMAPDFAAALARGVASYKTIYPAGGK